MKKPSKIQQLQTHICLKLKW